MSAAAGMTGTGGSGGWHLRLDVPAHAVEVFETAFQRLGGAVVSGGPDAAGNVPLDVYLAEEPTQGELTAHLATAAAGAGVALPAVAGTAVPPTDWVARSYRDLPPIRAGRFFVYGAHLERRPPPGSIALLIEASQAFGTGRHESTRGCLLALEALARRGRRVRRALDLGCGSGILAFAAARLWRCPVVAADNDPRSVAICRANARVNRYARWVRPVVSEGYAAPAVRRGAPYDLICANILAGPLTGMAGELRRHLAPGGSAVLSGLLAHQQRGVLGRHRAMGLVLERRLLVGDWATLVLRRPG